MSHGMRRFSLQVPIQMGTEPGTSGRIKVDEHYPSELDEPPPFDVKKIENIRSNVKFDTLYHVTKLIGDGKFGKVYQVIEKGTGREFAAKFIKIRKEADRAEVEREVSILTQLRHPRIAQIYDAFYTTTNDVVLIMEIVRGGELFDRVAEETYELSELAVVMIICQLCEAIDYIHQQNILHLDVKPENIMCVSQTGNRIKLIDFGLARHYDGKQELKYMAGTPEFAAPEVIKFEKLDYHTDMWSVGVITYILLSGYSPFLGENLGETYCNVEKGVWEFTEEFDAVSPEAKDFISKLLIYDQSKRMLPHQCLWHPWIAKHRQKAQCNAILEKPLGGPQIDNKMMMRYNAKRKFRRMIIYVKFLIEMNRLRNSLKTRMSASGHKFFDPLLKMAEEKEKKISAVINSTPSSSSALQAIVAQVKAKENQDKKLEKIEEESMSSAPSEEKKKKKSVVKKVESDSETEKKTIKTTAANQVATEEPKKKKKSLEKSLAMVAQGLLAKEEAKKVEEEAKKVTIEPKKRASDAKKIEDVKTTPSSTEKPAADVEKPKKKKLSITSIKSEIAKTQVAKEKDSLVTPVSASDDESKKKKTVVVKKKKLPVIEATKTEDVETKKKDKPVENGTVKTASTSSVKLPIIEQKPPKGLPPIAEKKAVKTESGESSKENRLVTEEAKPVRQGALRKKIKSSDDVLNLPPIVTNLASTEKSRKTSNVSVTSIVSETADGDNKVKEKIIVKKKSLKSKDSSPTRSPQPPIESKPKVEVSEKSIVLEKTHRKPSDHQVSPMALSNGVVAEVPEKKSKVLTLLTEKKTTTTTSTTTSVKRKTETSEKKVHHTSDGKSVEEHEKKNSQQNNIKISQVTTKKEESPEHEKPKTSVRRSVLKQDSLKTTTEKKRSEAEKKDDVQVVKTKNSLDNTSVGKLSLEQNTQVNGHSIHSLKLAGTKTVAQKAKVETEAELTPRRSALKKAEVNISEEVTNKIDLAKNGKSGTISNTLVTKVKISPDASTENSSDKNARLSIKSEKSLKSSVKSHVSSISTRDSSEERKKVRFIGVEEPVKPQPLFGSGLQKMKSESSLHGKLQDLHKKTRDDGAVGKRPSILSDLDVDYEPREDFSFEAMRDKLTRRLSDAPAASESGPRRTFVPIPPTNSVKDRLKQFEKLKKPFN